MTTDERLLDLNKRATDINQQRAVVSSKINEFEARSKKLEEELREAGIDLSDPDEALRLLQDEIDLALNQSEEELGVTENKLQEIQNKINFVA